MRKLLLIIACSICYLSSIAQPYGNEWIDYGTGRYYFKLRIASDGLYRIDHTTLDFALQLAGLSLSTVDPRSIQVFAKGEEQYIHVEGESDGVFNPGDYIELYAENNDGWLDEQLYPSANQHTNPYYSLYNDTSAYFLTWDPSGNASSYRYVTVPFVTPAPTPLSYFWKEHVAVFDQYYHRGEDLGQGKAITQYTGGKGWMSGQFGYNNSPTGGERTGTFVTKNRYAAGDAPDCTVEVALTGINRGAGSADGKDHHVKVQYAASGGSYTHLGDVVYASYAYVRENFELPVSALVSDNTLIKVRTEPAGSLVNTTADYSAVAYIKLTYPHSPAFEGSDYMKFRVPASVQELYLNGTNFSTSPTGYLYDLGLHRRYAVDHNTATGTIKTNIAAGSERELFLCANSRITNIGASELAPVNTTGQFSDPATWERDSAYLIITHQKLRTQAQQYFNHRNTNYNPVLVDIADLYDQFAYGITQHPLSIRNFCNYALNNWSSDPQWLLLLGKAIVESESRDAGDTRAQCLVPTLGDPPSDNYLTAGLNGQKSYVPAIPTGRIAALQGSEVTTYLNKIKEFETSQAETSSSYNISGKQWQKHVLHFAGGNSSNENKVFRNYLGSYANMIEGPHFGAKVFLFSKTSGDVIEQLNTDSLKLLLKKGAALMTFFGHASGNSFDLSVDDPSLWENYGRYPVVVANSCFSGNIHLPVDAVPGISEQYVFTPNEGAIAFLATPDLSYTTYLNAFTNHLYSHISNANYGKSLSEQLQQACNAMGSDKKSSGVALEMTLHGDPALRIYPHTLPELTVNDPQLGASVSLQPAVITTEIDSFDVVVDISNLGRSTTDPFSVVVTRKFPNGAPEVIKSVVLQGINFSQQVVVRFAVDPVNGIGENRLQVEVDLPVSVVGEFEDFSNNIVQNLSFTVHSSDLFPIYPYDFAVVPSFDVTLRANTGFPFSGPMDYIFQIDTTDTYDSPFKKETQITQSGAVIEWDPELALRGFPDSTVFFWRVTPTSDLSKWREFSFQVISGAHGWGQDHFFQFKNNTFDFLVYDRASRTFSFAPTSRDLYVTVLGNPGIQELYVTSYRLDGQTAPLGEYGVAPGGFPSMAIVVIDSSNLKPWGTYGYENGQFFNADHQFGNSNNLDDGVDARLRVEYFFTFSVQSPAQMDSMVSMITNKVDDGHYILAYSLVNAQFQNAAYWTNTHYGAFEALGADSIRYVPNDYPYIFLVKKGRPETAIEVIGRGPKDKIILDTTITSTIKIGNIESPKTGPAMDWQSFHLRSASLEASSQDSVHATAIGINAENSESEVGHLDASGIRDLSQLPADSALQMRLAYYTEDNVNGTPGQLKSWHILYSPAPDAAVNPLKGSAWTADRISGGAEMYFGVAVENTSAFDFDSLYVHYWLSGKDGALEAEKWLAYASLPAQTMILDSVAFSTKGLSGNYTLWMEVNPRDHRWHKEQYHFNNTAYRSFEVSPDQNNPLLDVTFDGIHILNGDIVSPSPEIVMELKDENQFLLLNDTSSFDVFMQYPNGSQLRIPFVSNGKEIMFFEPAADKKNKARVTYKPDQLADGTYKLSVMGKDVSGNNSGKDAYSIEFEVINRSMVTQVMNYPNPFSTATRFVFTLTGSRIPDVFTIQVLTVTGKVVREITQAELGSIHIGRNITEYAWDGRDEYGDRLANGVYIYRVIMKIAGEKVEHMDSEADQYFTKEFGKMYLFR